VPRCASGDNLVDRLGSVHETQLKREARMIPKQSWDSDSSTLYSMCLTGSFVSQPSPSHLI
jgi:hypothetical protein